MYPDPTYLLFPLQPTPKTQFKSKTKTNKQT